MSKKRTYLRFVMFIIAALNLNAESSAFIDAQRIKKIVSEETNVQKRFQKLIPIFMNYTPKEVRDPEKVIQFIKENPFYDSKYLGEYQAEEKKSRSSPSPAQLSTLGGLNLGTIAEGLVAFMIKRSEQELVSSMIDECDKMIIEYPELAVIFSHTREYLLATDKERSGTGFPSLLLVQASFRKDILNLPQSILDLPQKMEEVIDELENKDSKTDKYKSAKNRMNKYSEFFDKEENDLLLLVLSVTSGLLDGKSFHEILQNLNALAEKREKLLPDNYDNNEKKRDVLEFVRLSFILSESVRASDDAGDLTWIGPTEVNDFIKDPPLVRLYFMLLYQSIDNAKIYIQKIYVASTLEANKENIERLTSFASMIMKTYNEIDETRREARSAQYDDAKFPAAVSTFCSAIRKLFNPESGVPRLIRFMDLTDESWIACLSEKMNTAMKIVEAVQTEDYQSVFLYATPIADELIRKADHADPIVSRIFMKFIKLGNFATAVAQAQSAEEVQVVLEAYALPAGSYRQKYERITATLNSYLGAAMCSEAHGVFPLPGARDSLQTLGAYAPVGIAVNFPFIWRCSFSVFLGIVDLGAIASYRLGGTHSAVLPDFSVENILAPSINGMVGIAGSPISLGIGLQIGPVSRDGIDDSAEPNGAIPLRLQALLVVDLPLFNILMGD